MTTEEINFDGIVGPTHNYSGLSYGNIASQNHQYAISNPREAALQGLHKMKFLVDLGIKQGVLPPQERPHISTLHALGFTGTDAEILEKASKTGLLIPVSSASSMWAANAATVTPSIDASNQQLHLTTANLSSKFHRSIEAPATENIFRSIFHDAQLFTHHSPLPSGVYFSDEGAANHTRFCREYGTPGVHLFVYGRHSFKENVNSPLKFPARQTYEASQAIARQHGLRDENTVFAQQHPAAIDAGAFHNDVVAVGNQNVFFFHEQAYLDKDRVIEEIHRKMKQITEVDMIFLEVKACDITLEECVSSYLFNSQLITLPKGGMALIAPIECSQNQKVHDYLKQIIQEKQNPIRQLHFLNLRESMNNGGGPACLRLRVPLTTVEFEAIPSRFLLTDQRYHALVEWVNKYYRDRLHPNDLSDPQLLVESRESLQAFNQI